MRLKKTHILFLIFILIGIVDLMYSVFHWYSLQRGDAVGASFCNINDYWSCDRASLSEYGAIFNIPIGIFGALWLIFLGLWSFGRSNSRRSLFLLSAISWVPCVGLAAMLFFNIKAACLVCLIGYFSFIGAGISSLFFDPRPLLSKGAIFFSSLVILVLASFFIGTQQSQSLPNRDSGEIEKFKNWFAHLESKETNSLHGFSRGSFSAPVKIYEFSDFECPHCARAAESLVPQLLDDSEVSFTFVPFPLDSSCNELTPNGGHIYSCEWARAGYCANQQSKFWELHDLAFGETLKAGLASVKDSWDKVLSIGLNESDFKKCFESEDSLKAVKDMIQRSKEFEISATPTFLINGKKIDGLLPADLFKILVKEAHP